LNYLEKDALVDFMSEYGVDLPKKHFCFSEFHDDLFGGELAPFDPLLPPFFLKSIITPGSVFGPSQAEGLCKMIAESFDFLGMEPGVPLLTRKN